MSKITLSPVGDLTQPTTAVGVINSNSATVQTAFDNTLSRDGTAPNQMEAPLDMNSNQILNLPQPATNDSPLRLQDLNDFIGGGSVTNIPAGGASGDVLAKTSGVDYQIGWATDSSLVNVGSNLQKTGTSPVTLSVVNTPSFGAGTTLTTPTITTPILNGTVTGTSASSTSSNTNLVSR